MAVMFRPIDHNGFMKKGPPDVLKVGEPQEGPHLCIFGPDETKEERIAVDAPRDPTEPREWYLNSRLWNRDFKLSIWGT